MSDRQVFQFAARTDTGLIREHNEDALAVDPDLGFAILADGMGGYNAGEVASRIAVEVVQDVLVHGIRELDTGARPDNLLAVKTLLIDAVEAANAAVLEAAGANPGQAGMGTTLVAAVFRTNRVFFAHVGDSRLYRYRNDLLQQLTRDHTLVQEEVDAGLLKPEEAVRHPHRNLLTRAVGISPHVEVAAARHLTRAGDLYLLCSDGLTDMVAHDQLRHLVQLHDKQLDDMATSMVDAANANGGADNVSVVVLCPSIEGASEKGTPAVLPWSGNGA